jgi:hypothetical protein
VSCIYSTEGLTPTELEIIEPIKIGPTWQKNAFGQWLLPEFTLGWQIAGWCSEYLQGKDGKPWKFTKEQLRFILWWYAVDRNGRFIYRKGVFQRMKGHGKDPLVAVMCLVEFVGPSRFSHFDADGNPVGIPHPQAWVQCAAVSRDQTRNTFTLFPGLMTDHFIATYNISPGIELIRAHNGRQRLEAVTSSFRALEGGRSTFVVLNETHHWIRGNNGDKMYETIDGNATKGIANRYLAITNAFIPGEESVAETMRFAYEKILEGRAADIGFVYDSLEADPRVPLAGPLLPLALERIRGDSIWLDVDTIMQSIADTSIPQSRSRRMWLNQIVAEEEALHGPETWDPLRKDDEHFTPGDEIALGFDGGKTDDSTALVAIRVRDAFADLIGIWEKPDGPQGDGWEIDKEKVDRAVQDTFRTYTVVGFYADVNLWESYVSKWAEEHGESLIVKAPGRNAVAWDMRSSLQRVTRAHERLMRAIFDRVISHNGNRTFRRHVLNARRRENNYGVSFGKESKDSPRKVDAYAALMLAHEAMNDYRTGAKKTQKPHGSRGWFL